MGLGRIWPRSRWDRAHRKYTCADGKKIRCDFSTVLVNLDLRPRNGVQLERDHSPTAVVGEVCTSRDMSVVIKGCSAKTCALPRTAVRVGKCAFNGRKALQSVTLNEGLEELETQCF